MITFEWIDDGTCVAVAEIEVGVETRTLRIGLGPWFAEPPDPSGLGMAPVVALPEPTTVDLARAGALRAGRQPVILVLDQGIPSIGGQLLVARGLGAEVILVPGADAETLRTARGLAGQPILALPLDEPEACRTLLFGELGVDVHVPVPSLAAGRRRTLRSVLSILRPERVHHVVEVDPRPAFPDPAAAQTASLTDLAAAAAGVLAGRMAAAARRWSSA